MKPTPTDQRLSRSSEYRAKLSEFSRCMKRAASWSVFAKKMYLLGDFDEGVWSMRNARYWQEKAYNSLIK